MKTFYFVLKPPVIDPKNSSRYNEIMGEYVKEQLNRKEVVFYDNKFSAKKSIKIPFVFGSIEIDENTIVGNKKIKDITQFCSNDVFASMFSLLKYDFIYSANNSNKKENKDIDLDIDTDDSLEDFCIIEDSKDTLVKKKTKEKINHFYTAFAIKTSKIFTLFIGKLKDDFHRILGLLIFEEFEKGKLKTYSKPIQDKKNDIAYLACSLNDDDDNGNVNISFPQQQDNLFDQNGNVFLKKISIDTIDFSFEAEEKKRHLRFKNDKCSASLFFKEFSSGNFSPALSEDRCIISNNYNNSSRKKPRGSIILNKANIKSASDQNAIKEYIINYVTNLNHTDVLKILNPFNNQQEPLTTNNEIDVKQRIVVELFLSNNDMIDEKLREDFSVEKIKVTYSKDFEIKEFYIFEKEIYPTLEITEYNMSLQRY